MKIIKLFLIVTTLVSISCLNDNKVIYPYNTRVENLRDNIKNGTIDLFEAFMEAQVELRNHPGADSEMFLTYVTDLMNEELKKLYESGKFEEACVMADSLVAANVNGLSYPIESCYNKFLDSTIQTKDKFTISELRNRMVEKKISGVDDAYSILNEYYEEKSSGLFIYYISKYAQIFPDLLLKHPDLLKKKAELEQYKNLDFEKMMKSVVTVYLDKGMAIKNGMGFQEKSIGTGFFIDDKGYILTNHHVIADHVDPKYKGFTKVTVALRDDPDTEISAKVIGYDKVHDVALLKVETHSKEHLVLGRSHNMRTGDKIYTIGNPIGLRYTVTSGIISNKEINFFQMGRAFQVDAAINPGNSGGPLIDESGQVIGIVFAGVPQFQGISFAIPFEWVRQSIPLLYRGNQVERSWIGAGVYEDRDKRELSFYYIMPGSGADKSGLQLDDILVSINDQKVTTLEDAQTAIAFNRSPSIIKVEIIRNGITMVLPVKTDARPYIPIEKAFIKDKQANLVSLVFGLRMSLMSKMLGARSYKVERIYKGLTAYTLDISEGDPVMIYGIKYIEKDKMILMQIRYLDKDVAAMERMFTLQISAEINTLL